MQDVRRRVLAAREGDSLRILERLAPALQLLPTRLAAASAIAIGRRVDLQASNIPGPSTRLFLAGSEIRQLYPFGPLPGAAAMITMLSYAGTCCIGVVMDEAAVEEPELFVTCIREGFAEVLELAAAA
jgi:hypothetical protein